MFNKKKTTAAMTGRICQLMVNRLFFIFINKLYCSHNNIRILIKDAWTSVYSTKPVETQFTQAPNFNFNSYSDNKLSSSSSLDYNSYYNQAAYMHSSSAKQSSYYGLPDTSVANNQFNNGQYISQPQPQQQVNFQLNANFDCRQAAAIYKNNEITTTDEANNSNNTSPLEQMNSLNGDSPVNSELVDSLEKNNNNSSYDSNKENMNNDENNTSGSSNLNNIPAYFTTQKVVSNTVKLSYTAYQLELLNAIYTDMKYPNSVQKTLVAKLIGITRDQVKVNIEYTNIIINILLDNIY